MRRFEKLLRGLPAGFVFDGEIVCLDERGRPVFNDLLFGRREPVYLPFDVLFAHGEDVRALSLKDRKEILDKVALRYGLEKAEPFHRRGAWRKEWKTDTGRRRNGSRY